MCFNLDEWTPNATVSLPLDLSYERVLSSAMGNYDTGLGRFCSCHHLVNMSGKGGNRLFDDDAANSGSDCCQEGLQAVFVVAVNRNDCDIRFFLDQHVGVRVVSFGCSTLFEPLGAFTLARRVRQCSKLNVGVVLKRLVKVVRWSTSGAVCDNDGSKFRHGHH